MMASEIMNPEVYTMEQGSTVKQAAELMVKKNTKFLLITRKDKLAGIVTEWDFVSKVVAKYGDQTDVRIDDVMSSEVIYIKPDTDVSDAAAIMKDQNIKKLPVVEGGTLLGVVTAMDIVAAEPRLLEKIGELVKIGPKKSGMAG